MHFVSRSELQGCQKRSLEQGESQREECQDYLLSMPEADDLEKRDCGIP